MLFSENIAAAPRDVALLLRIRDRDGSQLLGLGVIQRHEHAGNVHEDCQFSYVSNMMGRAGVSSRSSVQLGEITGWGHMLSDTPFDFECNLAHVKRLEGALLDIRDQAAIATEYGHTQTLVNALSNIADVADTALNDESPPEPNFKLEWRI